MTRRDRGSVMNTGEEGVALVEGITMTGIVDHHHKTGTEEEEKVASNSRVTVGIQTTIVEELGQRSR